MDLQSYKTFDGKFRNNNGINSMKKLVELGTWELPLVYQNSSTTSLMIAKVLHCTLGGKKVWRFWFRNWKKFKTAHFESL